MLELKHVSYSHQSYQEEIFSDVNYPVQNGTFYSIIGQSGAGESTLLSPPGWSGQSQEGAGSL